ncbi:unnamed protein product [Zymoseptoria tritici ST99CH_3D7]|uniref:Rhodopsin domain-containing protein n=1 Tax=Zymoseptoria tritici (strain ST99CH_3D7) TaxID=1276538 RepID=A0A1X7RPE2_ZYMT9|nr:unnamed protein product [Zymoseptoria tritici ST99CH_3D7]
MASSILFILILSLLHSTAWAQTQLSPEAAEAALHLPPCVSKCGLDILPQFNCTIGEDCYCARTGPLEDALASCVIGGCPSLGDALAGLKFQALSCNYRTDRNITPLMFSIVVAMFSVATFFTIARFISRWPRLRGAGLSWDDGVVLFCFLPVTGLTIMALTMMHYGVGKDMWTLEIDTILTYAKYFYATQPLYNCSVLCTKLSLVLLYLRIWPREKGKGWTSFHVTCCIMIFALIGTTIAITFATTFACHPLHNAWRYANRAGGTCTDRVAGVYAYGGLNISYDIIVLALPITRLLRLKVSTTQKLGFIACFLVGIVATGCSIYRMFTIYGLTTARNITWDFTSVGLWSLIEVYVSMICCCMPATAGLLTRCWHRARKRDSMGRLKVARSPSFIMLTSEKMQGDSTWGSDEESQGIAAMPAIEPLQIQDEDMKDPERHSEDA